VSGELVEVKLPKWGMMMEKAVVVQWLKKEGDKVTEGEEIVICETEKIVNPVEAPVNGTLVKIVAKEGETIPVGSVLALIKHE
jgi:pyruvate dehydrogenase E2 component (dihydrolipoamide acetyltransferase)